MEIALPKTLTQMKKRLEEAMSEAREAEEIIPLLKEAITKFELVPDDLFEMGAGRFGTKLAPRKTLQRDSPSESQTGVYQDAEGNTWAGKGRRPRWLNEALERGKTLEDFLPRRKRLQSAK
jgi:DNA-binding protein H-NS